MAIDRDTVRHVARLARIALSPEELETFTGQLARILEYVEMLRRLDTSGVAPMEHTPQSGNVLREDRVLPSLPPEKALEQAPSKAGNLFRVPRVVE